MIRKYLERVSLKIDLHFMFFEKLNDPREEILKVEADKFYIKPQM